MLALGGAVGVPQGLTRHAVACHYVRKKMSRLRNTSLAHLKGARLQLHTDGWSHSYVPRSFTFNSHTEQASASMTKTSVCLWRHYISHWVRRKKRHCKA